MRPYRACFPPEFNTSVCRVLAYFSDRLVQISFWIVWRFRLRDSVHPPPLLPRWATALHFVIPTGAQRRGGTCSFAFRHSGSVVASGFRFSMKWNCRSLLRCAPVGMTKWRVTAHLGRSGSGWTKHNINQPAFVGPRSLQRVHQVAPSRSPFVGSVLVVLPVLIEAFVVRRQVGQNRTLKFKQIYRSQLLIQHFAVS
jgi:hypothetical protein